MTFNPWATIFDGPSGNTDVGLTSVSDLTASATMIADTAVGLDSSATAVRGTLPAATGSRARILVSAVDVTNDTEVKAGDNLDGVALGAHVFRSVGESRLFVDNAPGEWVTAVSTTEEPYLDRDPFGVRSFDPDPAVVGRHYTLTYSAGGGGFSLPPLANAEIGDVITFTNTNGESVMLAPSGGEILNGVVNNNTVISQAAGEYWRIEKVSATEWLATELTPDLPVTVADEFNSTSANPSSTDATLTFDAGDLTFTDPLSVETWFAGQTIDATSVGGSATQSAVLIGSNYTLLVVSGPTAITDSPYVVWFSDLNAGDTIDTDPAMTDVSVVGAGTLTAADQVTADGTGIVGVQVTGVGGLTLAITATTTHFFGEIPAPATATSTTTPIAYASFHLETGANLLNSGGTGADLASTNSIDPTVVPPITARLPISSTGGYTVAADVSGMTLGTDEITVDTTGRYAINGQIQQRGVSGGANTHEATQLIVNGAIVATFAARDDDQLGLVLPIAWEGDLNQGDVIDLRVRRGNATTVDIYRFNLNIRQQPDTMSVPAGSVPVVDMETVEYAKTGALGFGPVYTLDNGRLWSDLVADYQYLRFNLEVAVTGVAEAVLRTITVKASDVVDASRWRFEYGTGVVDVEPGALNTGDFRFSGATIDSIALEIVGIRAQSTVLSGTTAPREVLVGQLPAFTGLTPGVTLTNLLNPGETWTGLASTYDYVKIRAKLEATSGGGDFYHTHGEVPADAFATMPNPGFAVFRMLDGPTFDFAVNVNFADLGTRNAQVGAFGSWAGDVSLEVIGVHN